MVELPELFKAVGVIAVGMLVVWVGLESFSTVVQLRRSVRDRNSKLGDPYDRCPSWVKRKYGP